MTDYRLLGPWIRRFLLEHLRQDRNLSENTQRSYRDCLVLLLPFLTNKVGQPVERLTIEHLSAVHLLRAGVDINTIRAWLGHVSIDTTNIYAEVDLEMKGRALAKCDVGETNRKEHRWNKDRKLMAFLRSL